MSYVLRYSGLRVPALWAQARLGFGRGSRVDLAACSQAGLDGALDPTRLESGEVTREVNASFGLAPSVDHPGALERRASEGSSDPGLLWPGKISHGDHLVKEPRQILTEQIHHLLGTHSAGARQQALGIGA